MIWRGHGVKPNKDMAAFLETMKERSLERARILFEHRRATNQPYLLLNKNHAKISEENLGKKRNLVNNKKKTVKPCANICKALKGRK